MMFQIRVTGPAGPTSHAFNGAVCSVGRDQSNDISLEGSAVSSRHCQFELTQRGCLVRDLGSSNGTYVNGQRITQPTPVTPADRTYVGSVLLELVHATASRPVAAAAIAAPSGPILRSPGANRDWRDQHSRLGRYADEWDGQGRPDRLLLKGDEVATALGWLRGAQAGTQPEVTRAQRDFIEQSRRAAKVGTIKRVAMAVAAVAVLGGATVAAVVYWPESSGDDDDAVALGSTGGETEGEAGEDEGGFEEIEDDRSVDFDESQDPDAVVGKVDAEIIHVSIPFESLKDVARRYNVSVDEIAADNFLNPDEPSLPEGTKITINAPKARPLPQQKITYEIEAGEAGWSLLAARFDVPATKLESYNPEIEPKVGQEVTVWIDPRPYAPREPRKPVPEFTVDQRAESVGAPNRGKLVNGIQMPQSDLYNRAVPHQMYGASTMVANLQKAVATFRADLDFDGMIILSGMSKPGGGKFDPHKSHQSGRDIDIWLPTLKGVYKLKYIEGRDEAKQRRPLLDEVDWYATWGLVRALIQTGVIKEIFLDWRYQEFVYRAAVNMGATQDELDEWIQWPRSQASPKGIFRHSKDHLSHIHVRFKCAKWESQCQDGVARGPAE